MNDKQSKVALTIPVVVNLVISVVALAISVVALAVSILPKKTHSNCNDGWSKQIENGVEKYTYLPALDTCKNK